MFKERLNDYWHLTKPGISQLVVITSIVGYVLAAGGLGNPLILLITIFGTWLACAGSAVLNNYLEVNYDAQMQRTLGRALVQKRIKHAHALYFGIFLSLIGTISLAVFVNLLTGFIALLTVFLYVLVYTPLKRVTWLNTLVGAVPGALPPVGGWTAYTGTIEPGAVILFLIMFIWQMPHFYAIAWIYRDDYLRAGYKMICNNDAQGSKTFAQIIVFSIFLIIVSFLPVFLPGISFIYLFAAATLGLFFLAYSFASFFTRQRHTAVMLLKTTIIYLPLLFLSLILDSFI